MFYRQSHFSITVKVVSKAKTMPFGNLLTCFKQNVGDMAEQYGGDTARDLVEGGIEQLTVNENEAGATANGGAGLDVDSVMQMFTGKQQGGLTK